MSVAALMLSLQKLGISPLTIIDVFSKIRDNKHERAQDERLQQLFDCLYGLYESDDDHNRFEKAQSLCNQLFRKEIDELRNELNNGLDFIKIKQAREHFVDVTLTEVRNKLGEAYVEPLFGSLADCFDDNVEIVENAMDLVREAYPAIDQKESYKAYYNGISELSSKIQNDNALVISDYKRMQKLIESVLHDIEVLCGRIIDCGTYE